MSKTCNESCNWTNISDVRFMGDVVITSFSLGLLNNLERPKKCTYYVVCMYSNASQVNTVAKGKFNNGEIVKANLALFEQRLNLDFLELS